MAEYTSTWLYLRMADVGRRIIANVEALYTIAKWFKNRGLRLDKRTVKKY